MTPRLFLLSLFLLGAPLVRSETNATPAAQADETVLAAVQAADAERVRAMTTADRAGLEAIFSDELRYAHSNGKIDTKASFIETLTTHRTDYVRMDYVDRTFTPIAPGAVLMAGRMALRIRNADNPNGVELDLSYTAVWRLENGKWRFFAWQSCLNPKT